MGDKDIGGRVISMWTSGKGNDCEHRGQWLVE
jgi:hypothetical protein